MYSAVSAPVDAFSKRLESICDTVVHYYNKARGQEVSRETLKDLVEEGAKQGYVGIEDIKHMYGREKNKAADNGLEDAQYLYDVHDMFLLEDGRRVKTWRITKNLNQSLTDMIIWKAAPDINMRTKVVYSFECEVHRGGGEVSSHYKTKGSIGTLASLKEIENFVEECETQRLDLDDHEFWSKAYLPTAKTIKTPGSYERKVVFIHVQIKLITTNEPLLGCGPLPDWLRKKRCIYALDGKDERTDNLCVWRCLAIYTRKDGGRETERTTREALKLAREYYENGKLARKNVRATKLVDFEGIAKKFKVNIGVYKAKGNSEKASWMLVYD